MEKTFVQCLLQTILILQIHGQSRGVVQTPSTLVEQKLVTGGDAELLPSPIFYTTFVPIIYDLPIPSWTKDNKIQWPSRFSPSCTSDSFSTTDNQMPCPVQVPFSKIVKNFLTNLTNYDQLLQITVLPNSVPSWSKINFSCNEITNHFKELTMTTSEKAGYMEDLTKCPLGLIYQKKLNFSGLGDYEKDFNKMHENIINNILVHMISSYRYLVAGNMLNSYTAVQTSRILADFVQHQQWQEILSSCRSHFLPLSLIKKEMLTNSLKEISTDASRKNLQLSISDVSQIYKLPLTDCVRVGGFLSIRLLVPLATKMTFNLFKLRPIPFFKNRNYTQGDNYTNSNWICEIVNIDSDYIVDGNSKSILKTQCKSGQLCQIPNSEEWPLENQCASILLHGPSNVTSEGGWTRKESEKLQESCQFECRREDLNKIPKFRRLASDRFIIAGKSSLDIFIRCDGKPYQVLPVTDNGALEVILPCNCEIIYSNEEYHSMEPCGQELKFVRNIPLMWSIDTPHENLNSLNHLKATLNTMKSTVQNFTGQLNFVRETNHDLNVSISELIEKFSGTTSSLDTHIATLWSIICLLIVFVFIVGFLAIRLVMKNNQLYVKVTNCQSQVIPVNNFDKLLEM